MQARHHLGRQTFETRLARKPICLSNLSREIFNTSDFIKSRISSIAYTTPATISQCTIRYSQRPTRRFPRGRHCALNQPPVSHQMVSYLSLPPKARVPSSNKPKTTSHDDHPLSTSGQDLRPTPRRAPHAHPHWLARAHLVVPSPQPRPPSAGHVAAQDARPQSFPEPYDVAEGQRQL